MTGTTRELLEREHRRLDDLFGRFLAAPDRETAARAIAEFDAALRVHTELEEEQVFPRSLASLGMTGGGGKLAPSEEESERERLFRELRLEHVQVRELSGMIVRQLGEGGDARAARGLAATLARRWDAHTAREEREAWPQVRDSIE